AYRGAGRHGGRYAADRDAGSERRGPFAAELEVLARDEIDDGPIDQIRLDNRGEPAEHDRGRERELLGGDDADLGAEQYDRDLDIELGTSAFGDPLREARERIAHDKAREQRDDVAGFGGEAQRPCDAELLHVRGRVDGDVGVAAEEPADVTHPE